MRLRIIKNILKQGFKGVWKNKGMGLASVTSITAVLTILGIVLILILSLNNIVMDVRERFDEIQIFLEDDTTTSQLGEIENTLKNDNRVSSVIFKSKDEALEDMKNDWGEEGNLLEGLETNPLPNTLIVKLKDIEYADQVVNGIKDMEGIEEIQYNQDIMEKLIMVSNYIRTGGIAIVLILVLVSIFIISNTIKLTVTARRREINIMKYVGATNGYIRGPFIIEGLIFGIIGSIISILIINYGYTSFFNSASEKLYVLFVVYLVPPSALMKDIIIIFTAIGAGIGSLGSLVSMKKFLDV